MSTTYMAIGELDVVELLNAVDGWPAGTRGTVQLDFGDSKLIEVAKIDESREILDHFPIVAIEDMHLVWKCPPSDD